MKDQFDIKEFVDWNKVPGQYSVSFIKNSLAVKVAENEEKVFVACSENVREEVLETLRTFHSPKAFSELRTGAEDWGEFIGGCLENTGQLLSSGEKSGFDLDEISSESPAVNIINAICLSAVRQRASDIHIESMGNGIKVRFRIDGVMRTVKTFDKKLSENLCSRIKVMAGMNIMEKRVPQDGHIHTSAGNGFYDMRVSSMPAGDGESIVMRLFDRSGQEVALEDIGFSQENLAALKDASSCHDGLILVTGPTGSGKSTTLHSMIRRMDRDRLKIITIEDPVEKVIPGAVQVQVNEGAGLTFTSILRSVLRQDPDVIMVGEIRDGETASLAVRAALTGHLILSSLHTSDSVSSITRLRDLGIKPYLTAGVLKYAIAQRLVRRVCPSCKGAAAESKSCKLCGGTGYFGRIAVGEMFRSDENIAGFIARDEGEERIREYLKKSGFVTLAEDGERLVREGVTSRSELERGGLV